MADLSLEWRSDLSLTPGGDLALADHDTLTQQRIIRRLCTSIRGYVWHLDYGAGLPQKIGHLGTPQVIRSLIAANIALEASVATYPPPKISVVQSGSTAGLFVITIVYTDNFLGEQTTLSFDTTGQSISPALLLG